MNGIADGQSFRKFNPGIFQSDETVISQFVVRRRELDIVLEVLRGNIDAPSCQHVLIVAPRGRGKTMLMARIAAELRTNNALSGSLLPVPFMEENREILDVADFWLETLFHLARESARHDPELARELRETHADLSARWQEPSFGEQAHAAVLTAADRLKRQLVLMVENLQSLSEIDRDFGWKLRGALQSDSQIMLLASATSRFEGLDDAAQPFFELFRIIGLDPLDTDACRRLWCTISGDAVSERSIRPLEILTGGSPRLLVIVAGFAKHRSLNQLMEELVVLIDDHNEYFGSHLDVLPKTERRAYTALIDLWRPSKAGEIAARARQDIRIVSTMLGRLVSRGAVIVEGSANKRLYAPAERLYCIYYKLKRERDEATVVLELIRFMAAFYSEAELVEMSDQMVEAAWRSDAVREGIEQARTELPDIAKLIRGGDALVGSSAAPDVQGLVARALRNKGVERAQLGDVEGAVAAFDEVVKRFGSSAAPDVQVPVAEALFNQGVGRTQLGDLEGAVAAFDEVVERFDSSAAPDVQGAVAASVRNKARLEWKVLYEWAKALLAKEQRQKAMDVFRSAYAVFVPNDEIMMLDMLKLVTELMVAGVLAHDLVKILSRDEAKSRTLRPLVVALRQHAGEDVREPTEVLEVAADILQSFPARSV